MDLPPITKAQDKVFNKMFKVKPIKRSEEVSLVEVFGMPWYFDSVLSKLVLAFSIISLVYSIIRIVSQGFW